MKEVFVGKNSFAQVDDEDFGWISKMKWHKMANGYAARKFYYRKGVRGEWIKIYFRMHTLIMGMPHSEIDHIDGNKLNNQKNNLRLCNRSQNNFNHGLRSNTKSGYKGVSWNKNAKKWMAQTRMGGVGYYLGLFTDKKEAAKAYNKKVLELAGSFARINKI